MRDDICIYCYKNTQKIQLNCVFLRGFTMLPDDYVSAVNAELYFFAYLLLKYVKRV